MLVWLKTRLSAASGHWRPVDEAMIRHPEGRDQGSPDLLNLFAASEQDPPRLPERPESTPP
jgi:hypothetical protein